MTTTETYIRPQPLDLATPPPNRIHLLTFPSEALCEEWLRCNPNHRWIASLRDTPRQHVGEAAVVVLEYGSAEDCLRATNDAAAKARSARKAYQRDAMRITRERRQQTEEVV